MDEAGYEVVLGEVVEWHATDICRREVKLRGQQIRRDAKKAVVPEVLPDAPEKACPDCVAEWERYDRHQAIWERCEKAWERERENLQRELRLKDREIAHLTDRSSHYEDLSRDYAAMIKSNCPGEEIPTEAEPPAAPSGLNEYGDVGLR